MEPSERPAFVASKNLLVCTPHQIQNIYGAQARGDIG